MRRGLLIGLGLSLAAGGAAAMPYDDRFDPRPEERYEVAGASPWYRDGRQPEPMCGCETVRLPASFFDGAGGVGPIPDGGYYGGGYGVFVGAAQGMSSARAFAGASASARVSVSVRGGGHHRGGHGKK